MAAFVPDWNPMQKQKPLEPAPWAVGEDKGTYVSTNMTHFPQPIGQPRARLPIKPVSTWDRTNGEALPPLPRSTSQDSYNSPPPGFKQLGSFKPKRIVEATSYGGELTTTARQAFVQFYIPRTQPVLPKQRPIDPSIKFNTRPTTLDAFQPWHETGTYRKREPILPKSNGYTLGDNKAKGSFETTASTSFVEHVVKRYVPPPRPKPTLGSIGDD